MENAKNTRREHEEARHERPAPSPADEAQPPTAAELTDEILRGLEERGLPPGAWLVDIGRARHALQEADNLLRRLEAAIIRSKSSSPLDPR